MDRILEMKFFLWLKNKFKPAPKSVYQLLGGEKVVRAIVAEFYQVMKTDPKASECLALHANDLQEAADKLFLFLSGWLGGPPLYEEKYGHPRLRMRHLKFPITTLERDQWLYCMEQSLDRNKVKPELKSQMMEALSGLAERVRNS